MLKDRDQQQREMLIAIRSDLAPANPKSKLRARKPKTDAAVAVAAKGKKRQQLQLASELVTEEIERRPNRDVWHDEIVVGAIAEDQSPVGSPTGCHRPGGDAVFGALDGRFAASAGSESVTPV